MPIRLRVGVSHVVPLFDRYVAREVASHALGGFFILLAIFLVTRLSTLLSDAAVGSLPGGVLTLLLGLRTMMALPSLLPAVLYLGVLLAMDRLSRDRELLAMEASGVTPGRLERTVLGFAFCGAAGIVGVCLCRALSRSGRVASQDGRADRRRLMSPPCHSSRVVGGLPASCRVAPRN